MMQSRDVLVGSVAHGGVIAIDVQRAHVLECGDLSPLSSLVRITFADVIDLATRLTERKAATSRRTPKSNDFGAGGAHCRDGLLTVIRFDIDRTHRIAEGFHFESKS